MHVMFGKEKVDADRLQFVSDGTSVVSVFASDRPKHFIKMDEAKLVVEVPEQGHRLEGKARCVTLVRHMTPDDRWAWVIEFLWLDVKQVVPRPKKTSQKPVKR